MVAELPSDTGLTHRINIALDAGLNISPGDAFAVKTTLRRRVTAFRP
jgi:hypothetical protein